LGKKKKRGELCLGGGGLVLEGINKDMGTTLRNATQHT